MLGLGINIAANSVTQGATQLVLYSQIFVYDLDDENVAVLPAASGSDTLNALYSGVTQGVGKKLNGTFELTVTNVTRTKTGTKRFNVFQYSASGTSLFFLSTSASDITISTNDDFYAVDLTLSTFQDSGGSDADLDAGGPLEQFSFSGVLSIDGCVDSNTASSNTITIDAA
jgi:hypothetical protein